jgi:oxygen-dependent protoporphyrinogen oxidase
VDVQLDLDSNQNSKTVTVVGAGFSGLATAFYLVREGFKVKVIEARPAPGGLLQTVEDGFGLTETAANAILNTKLSEELLQAIGVEILPTLKASRKRFIFRRGEPRRWPFSFDATLKFVRFLFQRSLWPTSLAPKAFETLRDWGNRAVGRELTEYGIEAFQQGIYAGDPARLSASLLFGRFFKNGARPARPSIRGSVSAKHGMSEIIEKLKTYLELKEVEFVFDQKYRFTETHSPKSPVVVATSVRAAAEIIEVMDAERAGWLNQVETLPLLSATVFFKNPTAKARGFGCLFPPREKRPMLGVLMNTYIFPNRSRECYSETWIFGGASSPSSDVLQFADQDVLDLIEMERRDCFGTLSERDSARITRWPVALPHYTCDLEKILPLFKRNRQNIFLVGNYLGEIGLSRILDLAKDTVREIREDGVWEN